MKRINNNSRAKLQIRLIDEDSPCNGLSNELNIGEECQINRCEMVRISSGEALKPALTVKFISNDKVEIKSKWDLSMVCITDYEGYDKLNDLIYDYTEEDGNLEDFVIEPHKKAVISSDAVILMKREPRLMIIFPENSDNAENFINPKRNMMRPVYGPGRPLRRSGAPIRIPGIRPDESD